MSQKVELFLAKDEVYLFIATQKVGCRWICHVYPKRFDFNPHWRLDEHLDSIAITIL